MKIALGPLRGAVTFCNDAGAHRFHLPLATLKHTFLTLPILLLAAVPPSSIALFPSFPFPLLPPFLTPSCPHPITQGAVGRLGLLWTPSFLTVPLALRDGAPRSSLCCVCAAVDRAGWPAVG